MTHRFPRRGGIGGSASSVLRAARQAGHCQVAVTLSIANHHASLPMPIGSICRGMWIKISPASPRRMFARDQVQDQPQIALEQIRAALLRRCPGVVLMDASYGSNSACRQALTELGLCYVAAIVSTVKVRPVRKKDKRSRRAVSVEALALSLPKHAWRTITWREGTNEKLQSRFARRTRARWRDPGRSTVPPKRRCSSKAKGEDAPPNSGSQPSTVTCRFRGLSTSPKAALAHRARLSRPQQEIGLGHY